jgi:peptidoglycan hydrolase-like amidase
MCAAGRAVSARGVAMRVRSTVGSVLFACAIARAGDVRIAVFGLFHPRTVQVSRSSASEFVLSVPGRIERRFHGRLEIIQDGEEVVPIVIMDIENAVASIVAAESPRGAGLESLKAQAVVARSYLLGARGRHAHADFCDTTHCQFLREAPPVDSPAGRATRTTTGIVLGSEGRVLAALYSADCGGSTRSGPYPFFGVSCPSQTGIASGHRYGLCQTGSAAMARHGATWKDILRQYFPAAAITFWNSTIE